MDQKAMIGVFDSGVGDILIDGQHSVGRNVLHGADKSGLPAGKVRMDANLTKGSFQIYLARWQL